MFPSDLTDDPVLARSDKRIRIGAAVPMLGFAAVAFTGRLLEPSRHMFVAEMFALTVAAQVLTWWGLYGVSRSRGWKSGVLFYTWFGGMLGAMALLATGVLYAVPVPLVAPVVATFARWRMARGKEPAA